MKQANRTTISANQTPKHVVLEVISNKTNTGDNNAEGFAQSVSQAGLSQVGLLIRNSSEVKIDSLHSGDLRFGTRGGVKANAV